MHIKHTFKTAFKGLYANKSRSALTMLGIIIGITAIILVVALGTGAQSLILAQIQSMGSRTLVVLPGRQPKGIADVAQIFSDSLRERDMNALKKKSNVPNLADIMPIVFGSETASYSGETYRLSIFGATPLITKIFDLYPDEGVFFTEEDIASRSNLMVVGSTVRDELFPDEDPIGKKIKIKNQSFRVIGILPKKGQGSLFNYDEAVFVPYTTAQQYIFGIKYFHRIVMQADRDENVSRIAADVVTTLRNMHNITDPEKDDFNVETQVDIRERLGTITSVLTLFLVSVAAISLLVGGIGIMNIMFVSVTERTREIGLRKALGATNKDILFQFLLEAVYLTGAGGLIGIALGAFLAYVISLVLTKIAQLNWIFSFPVSAAVIGLVVSAGVGLIFGIYPARKASLKSPIEALRYE